MRIDKSFVVYGNRKFFFQGKNIIDGGVFVMERENLN